MSAYAKNGGTSGAAESSGADAPLTRLRLGRERSSLTWGDAPAERLMRVVEKVTTCSGLVGFSCTSDGGALMLLCRIGTDQAKLYAASDSELEAMVSQLEEMCRYME